MRAEDIDTQMEQVHAKLMRRMLCGRSGVAILRCDASSIYKEILMKLSRLMGRILGAELLMSSLAGAAFAH